MFRFYRRIFIAWLLFAAPLCHGGPAISFADFQALAEELAPKVNLFAAAWKQDPEAEFFGGTTRDYLYWLKGQLRTGVTPQQLRARKIIDIREFIIGESDVDIVSPKKLRLDAQEYGVRKIDAIHDNRFDPQSEMGKNEIDQGFIPIEKIRLGRAGFIPWPAMGDGLRELYDGRITAHFTDEKVFKATHYAKQNLNHPLLMALRFLRLAAINFYQEHGEGYPDQTALFDLDPASADAVRAVIKRAAKRGELKACLEEPRFVSWVEATMRKAFRSYTNPTAAKLLFDAFGVGDVVARHPQIPAYNQYVFSKFRDRPAIEKNLGDYKVKAGKFFEDPAARFPGLTLFHGTRDNSDFRSILFQGILPSLDGRGGKGLYGVPESNLNFAVRWGGDPRRVVKFHVAKDAKLVDITQGEGQRIYLAYKKKKPKATYDDFAEAFGIDIVRYPYDTEAFVVKNSDVLTRPEGNLVRLLPLPALLEMAENARTLETLNDFLETLQLNHLNKHDRAVVIDVLKANNPEVARVMDRFMFQDQFHVDNTPYLVPAIQLLGGTAEMTAAYFQDTLRANRVWFTDPATRGRALTFLKEALRNESFALSMAHAGAKSEMRPVIDYFELLEWILERHPARVDEIISGFVRSLTSEKNDRLDHPKTGEFILGLLKRYLVPGVHIRAFSSLVSDFGRGRFARQPWADAVIEAFVISQNMDTELMKVLGLRGHALERFRDGADLPDWRRHKRRLIWDVAFTLPQHERAAYLADPRNYISPPRPKPKNFLDRCAQFLGLIE